MYTNIKENIANILTTTRIIFIPIIIIFYEIEKNTTSHLYFYLIIMAFITDYADGKIARKFKSESHLGKILDPIADKLLIVSLMITIIQKYNSFYITIPYIIMILRDLLISIIRQQLMNTEKKLIEVSKIGKYKTLFQIIGILFLIYENKFNLLSFYIGFILNIISLILSITSMYKYIIIFTKLDRKF